MNSLKTNYLVPQLHLDRTYTVLAVVVSSIYYDISAWPTRERVDLIQSEERSYFGTKFSKRKK